MKKFKKLFLFIFTGALIACSSDDNNDIDDTASIIGNWKLTSLLEDGVEQVEDGDCDEFIIFTSSTFQLKYFDGDDCAIEEKDDPISYTLKGNTITFTNPDDNSTLSINIIELTLSTLKLRQEIFEESIVHID